jgi:hypothetical protein
MAWGGGEGGEDLRLGWQWLSSCAVVADSQMQQYLVVNVSTIPSMHSEGR